MSKNSKKKGVAISLRFDGMTELCSNFFEKLKNVKDGFVIFHNGDVYKSNGEFIKNIKG